MEAEGDECKHPEAKSIDTVGDDNHGNRETDSEETGELADFNETTKLLAENDFQEEDKNDSATHTEINECSRKVTEEFSEEEQASKMDTSELERCDKELTKQGLTRQDSSKVDIEKLGYVEVTDNDVKGIEMSIGKAEGGNKGNPKFELEEEEDDTVVFSEFVDKISVFSGMKVDSDVSSETDVDEAMLIHYLKRHQNKLLKMSLRNGLWGVKHEIRRALWFNLCHFLHKADDGDIFSEFAEDLFSPGDHSDIRIPSFVDMEHLNSYHLNQDGVQAAREILCVLEHSCPDIIYSPLLFSVLCLFLHYMDTSQCYNCIYSLLRHKDGGYLPTTKVSFEASKLVVRDLAKKYAKSGYVYLMRNSSNIDQVFDSWLWWLFEDLPLPYLVPVIDCYLREGIKIFYRVALAIVILFAKTYAKKSPMPKKDSSATSVLQSLRLFCREMPVRVDKLLKTGFGIRGFNRKEIRKLQVKHEMYINSTKHINTLNDTQPGGRLSISRSFSGPIVLQNMGTDTLTVDMLYAILKWIPTRYAICQPELLYTSEEHGTSLVTLYQRVENYQPTILVIKTTQDEVFGAYCSTSWRERRQKSQLLSYFGTGETFLFTLYPEKRKYEWVGLSQENIPNTASMFQAGDRSILTVGGGHGEAISLDENLLHCRSEKCDTFDNEPLSHTEDFQCKVVEVYGFV